MFKMNFINLAIFSICYENRKPLEKTFSKNIICLPLCVSSAAAFPHRQ
jgi:hypothetical protein